MKNFGKSVFAASEFRESAQGKVNPRKERSCRKKREGASLRDRTLVIPGFKMLQRVDRNGCKRKEVKGE